ncbi:hypothetical protein DAERI_060119 [Deinococcus aerius]|uniref:Uncharacterized protein n=1 Tax=Deinococcus aerius TaxID=200253 RepID=A0A2I9CVB0_9DEIO|nr:hypothetical protein [Deinococcus aerius]GBF05859.1 hypothetical protein DAERI_060119 [Deinococcus aerius]
MALSGTSADAYRRMTRGVVLSTLYMAWHEGLTDPANNRTLSRTVLETTLTMRAAMPPREDLTRAVDWLEGAGYVEVEWGMDDRTTYDCVKLTQKGIDLYENRRAAQVEPGIALPPRR